jgi:hypothetical protein
MPKNKDETEMVSANESAFTINYFLFDSDVMKIDVYILSDNSKENEGYIRVKRSFNSIWYLHLYFCEIILLFKTDVFFGKVEIWKFHLRVKI